jgi:hypothetical protein
MRSVHDQQCSALTQRGRRLTRCQRSKAIMFGQVRKPANNRRRPGSWGTDGDPNFRCRRRQQGEVLRYRQGGSERLCRRQARLFWSKHRRQRSGILEVRYQGNLREDRREPQVLKERRNSTAWEHPPRRPRFSQLQPPVQPTPCSIYPGTLVGPRVGPLRGSHAGSSRNAGQPRQAARTSRRCHGLVRHSCCVAARYRGA